MWMGSTNKTKSQTWREDGEVVSQIPALAVLFNKPMACPATNSFPHTSSLWRAWRHWDPSSNWVWCFPTGNTDIELSFPQGKVKAENKRQ
jgi:hypothetical protein